MCLKARKSTIVARTKTSKNGKSCVTTRTSGNKLSLTAHESKSSKISNRNPREPNFARGAPDRISREGDRESVCDSEFDRSVLFWALFQLQNSNPSFAVSSQILCLLIFCRLILKGLRSKKLGHGVCTDLTSFRSQ
jgi:hypothetical protein